MTQANKRRQLEAKEGWVKAGPRVSTQERSEGIISHTGEAPCWWPGNLQRRSFFPPFHQPDQRLLSHGRLPKSANVQLLCCDKCQDDDLTAPHPRLYALRYTAK